jgi:nicotinamide riboside kinase
MKTRRIAIVGAESTGKSWLAQALTDTLTRRGETVQWIPEVLRDWCEREGRTPQAHEQMAIAQAQAGAVLSVQQGLVISDTTPLMTAIYSHLFFQDESLYPMALEHQRLYDLTLVAGLDIAWEAHWLRDSPQGRIPVDALVRDALTRHRIDFRVIYGQGQARLNNALLALGLPSEDGAQEMREKSQFAINQGRTAWQCNECSDPDCEHKLFTGLLAQRSS